MKNPKITVKDIEDFLKDRYERFASNKAIVDGVERTVFMDVSAWEARVCIYYYDKGERVYINECLAFEHAIYVWNKL